MDLKSTLNLPEASASIPMKADLAKLETNLQASWDSANLYQFILDQREKSETYVLHDGPPYTNSPIHIGTAMNKILKDFVVKSRTMMGYKAPYVPGYDNHGLPIEQAVVKKFAEKKITPNVIELRKACREHAAEYISIQSRQFRRLGVFGNWPHPYTTMDFQFEANIVRVFKALVEKDFIYKGLRPTLWSPTSRTALADTEIVYKDHVSKAIYVRFPLKHDKGGFSKHRPNTYTIIWTTTPWTIPANLAVAFSPETEYATVQVGEDHYIIAEPLVETVAEALGWDQFEILDTHVGSTFEGSTFAHPIFGRDSLAVLGDYVTTEDGTGVVHTAPGHGRDDFYTGVKYDLPILCPVDEGGVLTQEAGEFAGVFYKKCDSVVVDRLSEVGALLKAYDFHHSYPYAERDDQPVIFRATEQWYVGLDRTGFRTDIVTDAIVNEEFPSGLRHRMLHEIKDVKWYPESGENRISGMIRNRPDWCISRQRPWGVGIPIFYGARSNEPVLDPVAIEAVAQLVENYGSDAWFSEEPSKILPNGYVHPVTGETEFRKETDVLDVWFDSGSTNIAVLTGNGHPSWPQHWPADLYLEGSDQHRGWFNSSLIIGTAVRGSAPYRAVVTHGFVTDENGLKMSKRLGNVVDPEVACNTFGADVVRYWVASVKWENDVPCSDNLLKAFGEHYRNVRNAIRFLMMNLYDFNSETDTPETMLDLDTWICEQTESLTAAVVDAYEEFDFNTALTLIHNFCRNELSAFYLDVVKDRMYCDGKDWPSRRSGQAACRFVLVSLLKLIAPILPHTAEEAYQTFLGIEPGRERGELSAAECYRSIHAEVFDRPSPTRIVEIGESEIQGQFATLIALRSQLNTDFEGWKASAGLKDSQDATVHIRANEHLYGVLSAFGSAELSLLLKFSWITFEQGEDGFTFAHSPYEKCERSRLRRPDVSEVNGIALTARDRQVLGLGH